MAKTIKFNELTALLHPSMLALLDDFVAGYMAQRAGVTLEQARIKIDTDAKTRASYERKVARAAVLLTGPGGFALTKTAHTAAPVAPAAAPHTPADPDFKIPGVDN